MTQSTRHAVTAALMAGFFMVANGLALAWTLTTSDPHMWRQMGLEITETVLVEDTETATETLNALQELGVKLVLDDFGPGYSSLGYVKRFPLSFLKIDRSFVAELEANGRDAAIVSAIAATACFAPIPGG